MTDLKQILKFLASFPSLRTVSLASLNLSNSLPHGSIELTGCFIDLMFDILSLCLTLRDCTLLIIGDGLGKEEVLLANIWVNITVELEEL